MTGPAMIRRQSRSGGPSRAFPSLAVGLSHHTTNKTINPFRAGFLPVSWRVTGVRSWVFPPVEPRFWSARFPHTCGTRPGRNFPGSKSLASLPRRCRNSAGCNIARHFSFNRTNRPFAVAAASGQIIADLNNRRFHESQRTHGGFASAQTFVPIPEEQNANHG